MKAISIRPHYELHAERVQQGDSVSLNIYSVWPQARNDRSPHKILNLHLAKAEMDALGAFIKGGDMNPDFEMKNPKASSVLGMYVDEPIGMDHPLFALRFQTRLDAGFSYQSDVTLHDATTATLKRMREIFGDDIPEDLIRSTLSLVYAERDALKKGDLL
jgi:hypothetical protein